MASTAGGGGGFPEESPSLLDTGSRRGVGGKRIRGGKGEGLGTSAHQCIALLYVWTDGIIGGISKFLVGKGVFLRRG